MMNMGMGAEMGGMGNLGDGGAMMGGGGVNPNIPREPRGGPGSGMGGPEVGPQRTGQRGQRNFHPYAR